MRTGRQKSSRSTKPPKQSRLRREILAMSKDMHASGVMDDATYAQILARRTPTSKTVDAMKAARRGELVTVGSPDPGRGVRVVELVAVAGADHAHARAPMAEKVLTALPNADDAID